MPSDLAALACARPETEGGGDTSRRYSLSKSMPRNSGCARKSPVLFAPSRRLGLRCMTALMKWDACCDAWCGMSSCAEAMFRKSVPGLGCRTAASPRSRALEALDAVLREAEVRQHRMAPCVQNHVFRLQIAVNDAAVMQVLYREEDLGGIESCQIFLQAAFACYQTGDVATWTAVEHQHQALRRLEGIVQLDNEGVPDVRQKVSLRQGISHKILADYLAFLQHLHSIDLTPLACGHTGRPRRMSRAPTNSSVGKTVDRRPQCPVSHGAPQKFCADDHYDLKVNAVEELMRVVAFDSNAFLLHSGLPSMSAKSSELDPTVMPVLYNNRRTTSALEL
eukprot:CAMPEP_0179348222 /NCGR_PEP_ID=MMETSP0797-20121207/73583_1 /TAXON_ID=47934 /ORGANISM="Dinophysis acuminata, Strain DAEP01" /LENGTH=335 /DNA_ID=CAMNT_0021063005 /DNA_START=256 /DNA_END=1262 /DNA_ORIENTATION=+